ncbi:hypothetical protein GBA63_19910 [Rubrobacter tropicus]|uniref:Uncharacterized protein n=1 Tax=Rubrobacter tropicus TaxID=2653851 RepID=A0A6G8QDT4_9ACTN|nr:hypothetical protein [Rubrobacter tropicus]QIN84664.1 hypothetical protein GBA63_19910 [Rubrobacter tropicus]
MDRGRDADGGRPVEPGRARTHGNDPDAVETHRAGSSVPGEGRSRAENLGPNIPASGPTDGRRHEEEVLVSRGSTGTGGSGAGVRRYSGDHGGGGEDLASARRDSIRWGPIWAGLITALTTFLLLQLLAIGLGLVDVGPGSDGGGGWVPGLIGLFAFFTGGAVAGMTSAIRGPGSGLLNGFMVWALGTVLILLLSALGLGQLFGALGNVAGQVGPGALSGAAQSAQGAAPNVSPQEAEQALQTGAIGAFFGLLLSALASMFGGLLGGRSRDPIGRPTDASRD